MAEAPVDVTGAAVRSHIDRSFEVDSDDSGENVSETTPFRQAKSVELTRVRKSGSVPNGLPQVSAHSGATGTPDGKGSVCASDVETPSSEPYTVVYRIKSNDQLFRLASDTGGSMVSGRSFFSLHWAVSPVAVGDIWYCPLLTSARISLPM